MRNSFRKAVPASLGLLLGLLVSGSSQAQLCLGQRPGRCPGFLNGYFAEPTQNHIDVNNVAFCYALELKGRMQLRRPQRLSDADLLRMGPASCRPEPAQAQLLRELFMTERRERQRAVCSQAARYQNATDRFWGGAVQVSTIMAFVSGAYHDILGHEDRDDFYETVTAEGPIPGNADPSFRARIAYYGQQLAARTHCESLTGNLRTEPSSTARGGAHGDTAAGAR